MHHLFQSTLFHCTQSFVTSPSKALEPGAIDFHKISSIDGSVEMGIPKPEKTLSEYFFSDEWNILNTSSQSLSDNLILTKDTKEFLRFQWTDGDTRQIRGFQNMIPTNQSK